MEGDGIGASGLPERVRAAHARAEGCGFELSCEPEVGRLLAMLAAAAPPGARILELGTGAGVGLAWIASGLGSRDDVEVVSVDIDPDLQATVQRDAWPASVRFELGDGAEAVRRLGRFDLIFADAPGGKLTGLDHTLNALAPRGVLLVDDMELSRHDDPELRVALEAVAASLRASDYVVAVDLDRGSGVLLAVRRG